MFDSPIAPIVTGPWGVARDPAIDEMLLRNAVVGQSISGGKDGAACALAVDEHLRAIGHQGPKVLIHADLGRIEWRDSLPSCERLAQKLGWELLVVRRTKGDMIARWQQRWQDNVRRYIDLSCVRLILPWSTPRMRLCTAELKTAVITSALRKRFPREAIVNVTGIRHQESVGRARKSAAAAAPKLERKHAPALTWNAIIHWPVEAVFSRIAEAGLELHEAYRVFGASRVSCCACIMSSLADLEAAMRCPDNHAAYRLLVELEAVSSFAFQGSRWLADVAPHLLSGDLKARVDHAKRVALQREAIEARIPQHLLYTKGWPTRMPTRAEAEMLAQVRTEVGALLGLEVRYTDADSILGRYEALMRAAGTFAPDPA